MYVTNVNQVKEHVLQKKGARGVTLKYLLHGDVGAKKLQFRLFAIDVEGYTPLEVHAHEHEVFVLRGKALVQGGNQKVIVNSGDVLFISSFEVHQFKNIGDEKFEFLCTKETRFAEAYDVVTRIVNLITGKR